MQDETKLTVRALIYDLLEEDMDAMVDVLDGELVITADGKVFHHLIQQNVETESS